MPPAPSKPYRIQGVATCSTCPAYVPTDMNKPDTGGCHARGPSVVFMGFTQTKLGQPQPIVAPYYAGVQANDFCMEHPQNRHFMQPRPLPPMPPMQQIRKAGPVESVPLRQSEPALGEPDDGSKSYIIDDTDRDPGAP